MLMNSNFVLMIDEFRLNVPLRGEKFAPKAAQDVTRLGLQDILEAAEISPGGHYWGKPVSYGTVQLQVVTKIRYGDRLMWIISVLEVHLKQLYGFGDKNLNSFRLLLKKIQLWLKQRRVAGNSNTRYIELLYRIATCQTMGSKYP